MAQLKTGRIAANDLFSTYPQGQGGLEAALCSIFGFTPNTDITASAFLLDNSGRVTQPLISQNSVEIGLGGVGLQITNSSNSKSVMVGQNTTPGSPYFTVLQGGTGLDVNGGPLPGFGNSLFAINMDDGTLSGYTTQDGSSQPLLPPTGGVGATYYYNSTGQWVIPGSPPFNGCHINSKSTNIGSASSGFLGLWTQGFGYFDVGGHFDGVNKITSVSAGKYFVHVQVPVYAIGGASLNSSIELVDDGGNNLAFASYNGFQISQFLAMSTVWNASSGSSWLKVNCTANATPFSSGAIFGADNGIINNQRLFNGSITFFQIA